MSRETGQVLCGLAVLATIYVWFAYLFILVDAIGWFFGLLVAVVLAPGAVVSPLLAWVLTGDFPLSLLLVEIAALVCAVKGSSALSQGG